LQAALKDSAEGGSLHGIALPPYRPLLPGSARRPAAVLLAVCTILVAILGALFAHSTGSDRFDRALDAPVITWFAHRPELAGRLAAPGSAIPAAALSAVVVLACLRTCRLNGAVLAATAVPISVGLDELLLKPLVHRTYLGILTYPSGHTTAMFALAATVTILLLVPAQRAEARRARVLIASAAYLLGGIVAAAVIGLRWHHVTDTIGGAAVGIATVCGLALTLDLLFASRRRAQTPGRLTRTRPSAAAPRRGRSREPSGEMPD
jgi:undecaprenyl-diphosphatase